MKRGGFSLFELLLAIILLSIGLVALVNVFSIGLSEASEAKHFAVAKNLAEEKLEEIRNLSYTSVISEAKAPISGFVDYQRQVQISLPQTGLKQVQIDVFWQSKGAEVSIRLYSYVSDI